MSIIYRAIQEAHDVPELQGQGICCLDIQSSITPNRPFLV